MKIVPFHVAEPGDFVNRKFAGLNQAMPIKVTQITSDKIICGSWEFDRNTGAEIDEFLGWGNMGTGSFLED